MVFSDDGQDHSDCEFGDGGRGVGWYADDMKTVFGCSGEVDVVESCTTESDVFLKVTEKVRYTSTGVWWWAYHTALM